MNICSTCEWRLAQTGGECHTCYQYRRRTGKQRPEETIVTHGQRVLEGRERSQPPHRRLVSHVRRNADGCWIWQAALNGTGYGLFRDGHQRLRLAHRVAYELWVGPIPAGMTLDHLCRVRRCVNPSHLDPVTMAENMRRAREGLMSA